MGLQRINEVIEALQSAGIRADRGYPNTGMPYPSAPVVAVNLHSQSAEEVALAVTVYCSVADSGILCEDKALEVAAVLEGIGAVCQVGSCSFSGKTGLFSATVLTKWVEETEEEEEAPATQPAEVPPTVLFNDEALPYATGFSAQRSAEVSSVGAADGVWTVTVEELIPLESVTFGAPTEKFSLAVQRDSMTETYSNCYLETLLRRETSQGLYQKRVAKTWSEPLVSFG